MCVYKFGNNVQIQRSIPAVVIEMPTLYLPHHVLLAITTSRDSKTGSTDIWSKKQVFSSDSKRIHYIIKGHGPPTGTDSLKSLLSRVFSAFPGYCSSGFFNKREYTLEKMWQALSLYSNTQHSLINVTNSKQNKPYRQMNFLCCGKEQQDMIFLLDRLLKQGLGIGISSYLEKHLALVLITWHLGIIASDEVKALGGPCSCGKKFLNTGKPQITPDLSISAL